MNHNKRNALRLFIKICISFTWEIAPKLQYPRNIKSSVYVVDFTKLQARNCFCFLWTNTNIRDAVDVYIYVQYTLSQFAARLFLYYLFEKPTFLVISHSATLTSPSLAQVPLTFIFYFTNLYPQPIILFIV